MALEKKILWCHSLDFWTFYTYVESDDSAWIGKYPLYVFAHSGTGSPGNWITRPWLIDGSGEKWTHLLWWCMMNIWTFEKLQGFKDTTRAGFRIFCPCSRGQVGFLPIMNGLMYHGFPIVNCPKVGTTQSQRCVSLPTGIPCQGPPALVTFLLGEPRPHPGLHRFHTYGRWVRNQSFPGKSRLIFFGNISVFTGFLGSKHLRSSQVVCFAESKYHPRWHTYAATQAPWKLNNSVRCSVGRLNCAMRRYLK